MTDEYLGGAVSQQKASKRKFFFRRNKLQLGPLRLAKILRNKEKSMLINVHHTSTSARYFRIFQNKFLTGTIQHLSIPSQNFSHKCKKAIKSASTFGPPFIVHFKYTKNVRYILKITVSKSTKKRQATYGNLHYLRKWFRQCNLSSLNLTPHTIA